MAKMIDRIDVFPAPLFPISKTFCSGIGARRALRAKTSLSPPPALSADACRVGVRLG